MQKIEKSEIYGGVGSVLFGILLILLLFLIKFSIEILKEENKIELAVSEIEEAYRSRGSEGSSGYYRPESAEVLKTPQPSAPKPTPAPPAPNYANQNIEDNIAIERAKAEQRQREAAEAERVRKQQAEEQERQRIAAEQQAKADKAKNAMSGAFGGGGKGNGNGSGTGTGNSGAAGQGSNMTGNPVKGNGTSSDGHNWSLSGRDLVGGIPTPKYNKNEAGRITVNIRVDEQGNVTSASIGTPTEISSEELRNSTLESARKVRFTAGKNVAIGTLTYTFKLN